MLIAKQLVCRLLLCILVLVGVLPVGAATQAVTTLHSFSGSDGSGPNTVVRGTDGNFYGTTIAGGVSARGSVFRLAPDGVLTTLHSFAGPDGRRPDAALIEGSDGHFYGTTFEGGATTTCEPPYGCGTVFRVTSSGTLTTLHAFTGADGRWLYGGLVQGTDGNYYGVTRSGAYNDYGTVFRITPSGTLTTLYVFRGGSDGYWPHSELIQRADGNFYGTTYYGGANATCLPPFGCGTVFRMTPTGALTTLHRFSGPDGRHPIDRLVEGPDGNLYGTASRGGTTDSGTVFRLTPSGALTVLHSFAGSDGASPTALVQGSDGSLYGTTTWGGNTTQSGTAFRLTLSGELTVLHRFSGPEGRQPTGGLVQVGDSTFYGQTVEGGASTACLRGCGTLFRLTVPKANLRVTAIKAPTAVASGASFAVTDTTKNDGPGSADASQTAIWLSPNKTLGGDTELATRAVPTLAAGALNIKTTSVVLPTVAPGVYYLIAEADTNGVVNETNENDNLKVKVLTVGPDLYVSKIVFTPDPPTRTGSTIAVTTRNKGGEGVPAGTKTRVYLSANSQFEPTDTLLYTHTVPALGPGAASTSAFSPTLPGGTWYFIVVVDADDLVVEAKEGTANQKKLKRTVP